ncbi:MAG: hypothetical protein AAFX52_01740 [Pseudomonadota bacterium]
MATTEKHPRVGVRRTVFYVIAAIAVISLFSVCGDFVGQLIAEKRHGL